MEQKNDTVLVFGAGYVGFSLSVIMARSIDVIVVDVCDNKISLINQGISPIEDEGIERHLTNGLKSGKLKAQKYSSHLVEQADFVVLALPTNFDEHIGGFDTSILDDIIATIAKIDREKPIIIKSTVPVGYTQKIKEKYNLKDCFYSPEFLREGRAIHDNLHPSRIIFGSNSKSAKEFSEILIKASHLRATKIIFTDNTTAEVIKLASNSYLATRVAFFNEIDTLALKIGLNVEDLISGICADSRIGEGYNNPSFGYGGYCLPKDVRQFQSSMLKLGLKAPLIESIDASNKQRIDDIVSFIQSSSVSKIGIFRAQMKQGSDNARESVSLALLEKLNLVPNLIVRIYEPIIELPTHLEQFKMVNLENFCDWAEIILANRDAVELQRYRSKLLTRDIYNEN